MISQYVKAAFSVGSATRVNCYFGLQYHSCFGVTPCSPECENLPLLWKGILYVLDFCQLYYGSVGVGAPRSAWMTPYYQTLSSLRTVRNDVPWRLCVEHTRPFDL
jgi:hypothetical protein